MEKIISGLVIILVLMFVGPFLLAFALGGVHIFLGVILVSVFILVILFKGMVLLFRFMDGKKWNVGKHLIFVLVIFAFGFYFFGSEIKYLLDKEELYFVEKGGSSISFTKPKGIMVEEFPFSDEVIIDLNDIRVGSIDNEFTGIRCIGGEILSLVTIRVNNNLEDSKSFSASIEEYLAKDKNEAIDYIGEVELGGNTFSEFYFQKAYPEMGKKYILFGDTRMLTVLYNKKECPYDIFERDYNKEFETIINSLEFVPLETLPSNEQ